MALTFRIRCTYSGFTRGLDVTLGDDLKVEDIKRQLGELFDGANVTQLRDASSNDPLYLDALLVAALRKAQAARQRFFQVSIDATGGVQPKKGATAAASTTTPAPVATVAAAAVAAAAPAAAASTPGQLKPAEAPSAAVQQVVASAKHDIEKIAGMNYPTFECVSCSTQTVAGTNYFAKIKVGDGMYVHARIFKDLKGAVSVHSVQTGKKDSDPVEYFQTSSIAPAPASAQTSAPASAPTPAAATATSSNADDDDDDDAAELARLGKRMQSAAALSPTKQPTSAASPAAAKPASPAATAASPPAKPSTGETSQTEMICSNCNARLSAGSKFCNGCGAKVSNPDSELPKTGDDTHCGKCGKEVGSGVRAIDQAWHKECFTCVKCNTSLLNGSFAPTPAGLHCQDCYVEHYGKKCGSCGKAISGSYVNVDGVDYHGDCFKCSDCGTGLKSGYFMKAGKPLCKACSNKK